MHLQPMYVFACDLALLAALSVETLQESVGNHSGIDVSTDSEFHGLTTFASLSYANCLTRSEDDGLLEADICILGAPLNTVCTSTTSWNGEHRS
jgi:hypothetical protein